MADLEDASGKPPADPPFPKAPNTWKWAALGFVVVVAAVAVIIWLALR